MTDTHRNTLTPNGDRYPFTVPEHYFENLAARIMEKIPVEQTCDNPAKKIDIKQWHNRNAWAKGLAIAASFAIVATIGLKLFHTSTDTSTPETMVAEYNADDYNEALLTYTMADNIDVYNYLSDENDN